MYIQYITDTSCCGLYEFNGFNSDYGSYTTWCRAIIEAYGKEESPTLPAIVLFTGSSCQTHRGSPFHFYKWLKRKKEKVIKTDKVLNSNSGNTIQSFLWTPSRKFRSDLDKFYTKLIKEEKYKNGNGRTSSTGSNW